ncbi:ABC transporter permease [Saccharopolyspora phatthalungensis]|uniref:Peptide/nickel transport system permease protein n=1 Tax=Saccharopolyspora phatthalungensis TaxID=664693 RepID=A0A840QFN9_9PSEU|nr:ABC transporter permease [Saccharopolyspora phatthalungensis]MBB5158891.1 peptide/nickel transport system permease protein [Saccharopolyspora phatthalungensis]
MRRLVLRPLAVAGSQLAAVAVTVFALTSALPGDTAVVILGEHATDEQVAALRAQLHLDVPLWERFVAWSAGVAHGDLGESLLTGVAVSDEIARGFATTTLLTVLALAVVIPLALAVGVATGLRPGSLLDRMLNGTIVLLNSIPEFALALLLVALFAVRLGWLPATAAGASGWSLAARPAVLVLPVAVLVSKQLCALARQVRIGVSEADGAEYAMHARLHGLTERTVVFRHVLPNALGPAVQQLARAVDGLLGGVVVVEAVFALPGMGSGFIDAVMARDLPAVQGYALVFAITTIALNLLADVVSRLLVPQREVVA